MTSDKPFSNTLTRRNFLKKFSQAALAISGGLALETLLGGCAIAPIFESAEDIANIKWDANPAIPVPKDGCYVGWHRDIPTDLKYISPIAFPKLYQKLISSAVRDEKQLIDFYRADYGKGPAVHSFSDRQITDAWFPREICEVAHNNRVIPLIRYYFFDDFKRVAKGDYDKYLIKFAQGAKEFGKPFFFVPYPEANIGAHTKHVHAWGGSGGKGFKEAWSRMHDIFEKAGANEYAVWGLHLLSGGGQQPLSWFAVNEDFIDWVGFSVYNLERETGTNRSFHGILGDSYWWAKRKYPTKPIALWEFGTSDTYRQGRWIIDAYKDIKKLPRIKLVVYAEYPIFGGSTPDSTMMRSSAKPDYKKATSDLYFIGS